MGRLSVRSPRRETLVLAAIAAAAAALRLYGLNWDGGQWLQPDERQIYFVALGLGWPAGLAQALGPQSPLNPHFFAYGSLPIYLVRLAALVAGVAWPALRDGANLHLAGRPLAALADVGTLLLTWRLGRVLWPSGGGLPSVAGPPLREGGGAALLAAGLYAVAVLPIQLAHFYTADPLLALFVMLALNAAAGLARRPGAGRAALLGAALGLALATKVSAAPLLVVALAAVWRACDRRESDRRAVVRGLAAAGIAAAAVFVAAQPYAIIDWPAFAAQTARESAIAWGALDVLYTRQYAGTLPYLYPVWQTALWGLGPALGLAAWVGMGAALARWVRRGEWADGLLLAWAGPALAVTGALYAKPPRYMLPLVPVLCLFAARLLVGRRPQGATTVAPCGRLSSSVVGRGSWVVVLLLTAAYALAFASQYRAPHPWIAASEWIYEHVPAGSVLALEAWDTALPLPLDEGGRPRRIEEYDARTLDLYAEPDDAAKWTALAGELAQADYVIVAGRRGYGSIGRRPSRYPLTARYYERLFGGDLGFKLVAEFARGPAWLAPLPGAAPALLVPDESLTVYDRPRPMVLRNVGRLTAEEILATLREASELPGR